MPDLIRLFAEVIGLGLVVAIVLFLVGAWQHTRCTGFLVLAASFVAERVLGWVINAAFRFTDSAGDWVFVFPVVYLLTLGLAAVGCLSIYRHFRPAPPAAG